MIKTIKLCGMITLLFSCVFLQAKDKLKKLTLNDGKVLVNPVVLEQEPDGLSIGHQNGVMFVHFKDLPEKVQKKYNYNPNSAAKYTRNKFQTQKKIVKKEHQQKLNKQQRRIELKLSRLNSDISKLRLRIKYLQEGIAQSKKTQISNNNTLTQLATKRSKRVTVRDRYYWRGGYHMTIENTPTLRERNNERRLRKRMKNEAERTSGKINTSRKELANCQRRLASKLNEYQQTQTFYQKNFK